MIVIPQCFECKHLDPNAPKGVMRCDAFPGGIPNAILLAEHDHKDPFPGDHGILFEEGEPEGKPSEAKG